MGDVWYIGERGGYVEWCVLWPLMFKEERER